MRTASTYFVARLTSLFSCELIQLWFQPFNTCGAEHTPLLHRPSELTLTFPDDVATPRMKSPIRSSVPLLPWRWRQLPVGRWRLSARNTA
uniref:Uncharacterized protein n=1 Tax=Cynoglossus semilaevis TaxID=244447 RepID=A0A3P8WWI9_CYNSE